MNPQGLIERAVGASAPPSDPSSERILDAALELVAASGVRGLTMDDVATRAGVGRMTVYRRFGERERLIDALAAREARRCLAELDRAVDPGAPAAEAVAQGFATSLRLVRKHPVLARLAHHEPAAALAALNAKDGAIVALGREFVAGRIRAAIETGELDAELDADTAAELLVRLCFSFLVMPASALPGDEEAVARLARERIAPILTG